DRCPRVASVEKFDSPKGLAPLGPLQPADSITYLDSSTYLASAGLDRGQQRWRIITMKLRNCIAALLMAAGTVSLPASAALIHFTTILSGANEIPVVNTPGFGAALITVDTVAMTMDYHITFGGLSAGNTAAHIHCCTTVPGSANVPVATVTPTFTGFPTG